MKILFKVATMPHFPVANLSDRTKRLKLRAESGLFGNVEIDLAQNNPTAFGMAEVGVTTNYGSTILKMEKV